jgi:pimeloyl-ACP methyl ester carboxylesterase
MQKTFGAMALLDAFRTSAGGTCAPAPAKPTIVLVHGAFINPSGWDRVVGHLREDGFYAIAPANPLRDLRGDAAAIAALIRSIPGDVILVGHAYAGFVITEAARAASNVRALVYVASFIPDIGESVLSLSIKFPGSTLGDALEPAMLPGGGADLFIQPAKFRHQLAADVSEDVASLMAATQRPVTRAALCGRATVATWRSLPAFSIYGAADRNIPAAVEAYMAARARVKKAVEVAGGSHALMISHPQKVASLIEEAAAEVMRSRVAAGSATAQVR